MRGTCPSEQARGEGGNVTPHERSCCLDMLNSNGGKAELEPTHGFKVHKRPTCRQVLSLHEVSKDGQQAFAKNISGASVSRSL